MSSKPVVPKRGERLLMGCESLCALQHGKTLNVYYNLFKVKGPCNKQFKGGVVERRLRTTVLNQFAYVCPSQSTQSVKLVVDLRKRSHKRV